MYYFLGCVLPRLIITISFWGLLIMFLYVVLNPTIPPQIEIHPYPEHSSICFVLKDNISCVNSFMLDEARLK